MTLWPREWPRTFRPRLGVVLLNLCRLGGFGEARWPSAIPMVCFAVMSVPLRVCFGNCLDVFIEAQQNSTILVSMLGTENLGVFAGATVLLVVSPGQDTFYVLGRSMAQGRRAGVVSALGISTGGLVHVVAAAVGVSALIASSALAFSLVKWAGAGYLVYLGIQMIREGSEPTTIASGRITRVYLTGVLTNLLNPKVALFFLAFLPQFVAADSSSKVTSFLFLGALFMFAGTIWCLLLAAFGARIAASCRSRPRRLVWVRRLAGGTFIALGCRLVTDQA